jgi:hypothetical protein
VKRFVVSVCDDLLTEEAYGECAEPCRCGGGLNKSADNGLREREREMKESRETVEEDCEFDRKIKAKLVDNEEDAKV